jgi:hypothetical protein
VIESPSGMILIGLGRARATFATSTAGTKDAAIMTSVATTTVDFHRALPTGPPITPPNCSQLVTPDRRAVVAVEHARRRTASMSSMPRRDDDGSSAAVGLVIGALGPIAVALVLVPVRTDLHSANLALILVLVVVIAAIVGGRRAGALAAIVSTLAFDFFLTEPYLSMKIETSADVETALTLLGVGLLVGAVASRGRRSERGRERAGEAISRVHRVADHIARAKPIDDVVVAVTRELRELLTLQDCWLEFHPFVYVMPVLARGGNIEESEHHWFGGGLALSEDGVELPILEKGTQIARIVLIGNPAHAATIEERVVAVALGDQLGVALALAGPDEQARLAKESRQD